MEYRYMGQHAGVPAWQPGAARRLQVFEVGHIRSTEGELAMRMGELCNRDVVITTRDETVVDAARHLRDHHVGSCVVVDRLGAGECTPLGIVTDRDLVVRALAQGLPGTTKLTAVMSTQLLVAREEDDLQDALGKMRARGVRRMPVVDRLGHLQGIFTADDIVEWATGQLVEVVRLIAHEQAREGAPPRAAP